MDGDALSTVSVDSAADKDVGKSKKPRATRKELAAKRAAELADLKGVNLSLLTEAKRSITSCDHEFQQNAISVAGKWSIIAFEFNNGFIVSKEKFATGATEDVRFEPLSKAEHKPDDALSRKWEKVTLNFRMILCSKLDDSVQLKVLACASRSCATALRFLRIPFLLARAARARRHCAFVRSHGRYCSGDEIYIFNKSLCHSEVARLEVIKQQRMRFSPQDRVALAHGAPDRRARSRGSGQARTVPGRRTDAHAQPPPGTVRVRSPTLRSPLSGPVKHSLPRAAGSRSRRVVRLRSPRTARPRSRLSTTQAGG